LTTSAGLGMATVREDDSLAVLWSGRDFTAAASDSVYSTLREAILNGVLGAGARLAEEELAAQFAVSRTPVREAILRLEATALATRTRRGGLVVSAVSPDEILEVYAVREVVDGLAASLAAHVARESDLAELSSLNAEFREAPDARTMASVNLRLHEAIARAGGNGVLIEIMSSIHDRVRRFPGTTFSDPARAAAAITEHDAIIRAISDHDALAAEKLARAHMSSAMRVRIAMLHPQPR
jgi:DNA-binding GntR family transcriptional regulator